MALMHLAASRLKRGWLSGPAMVGPLRGCGNALPAGDLPGRGPCAAEWLPKGVRHEPALDPAGGPPIVVLTVDHGLRPESAAEARWVAEQAHALELPHATLRWDEPKPVSGVQAAAREARYRLIGEFLDRELAAASPTARTAIAKRLIVTAHTADDQIETFLMRLARGSGLEGLGGMRELTVLRRLPQDGEPALDLVLRPLLSVSKARTLATLKTGRHPWLQDPSNESVAFERVRIRQAFPGLDALGLSHDAILRSVGRLSRAREAVAAIERDLFQRAVDLNGGACARLDLEMLRAAPVEVVVRVLKEVIEAFGGQREGPELPQVEALGEHISVTRDTSSWHRTLAGCVIESRGERQPEIRIWREAGRDGLPEILLKPGERRIWDRRFVVSAAVDCPGVVEVRALGAASWSRLKAQHAALASWDLPAAAVATLPAFWRDGDLLATPHFQYEVAAHLRRGARISDTERREIDVAVGGPRQAPAPGCDRDAARSHMYRARFLIPIAASAPDAYLPPQCGAGI